MSAWGQALLGELAVIDREIVPPGAIAAGTRYVGLEHIEAGGLAIDFQAVEAGELASTKFAFNKRHVLYGKLRPYLAKIALPEFSGICSTDILPVLPGDRLDRRFLAHFLRQPATVALAASQAVGINLPRLSPDRLAQMVIAFPPPPEQRRIADILDRAEALRTKRRRALALLDELPEAVFVEMFGAGRHNWGVTPLGDLAEVQGGLQLSGARASLPVEIPYLRVANVYRAALDLREIKTMRATPAEIARTTLEARDLLLVEGHGNPAEIGRAALWDGSITPCIHQNHLIRARFDRARIDPVYASAFVNSHGGRQHLLRAGNTTSGLNTISVSDVRSVPMLVPPLPLQHAFARRVAAVEKLKAGHRASLAALDELFASLQHRAFRGEL